MKKFMLFIYAKYEAGGGMEDFVKDFDTVEEVDKYLLENPVDMYDYYHLFNSQSRQIVRTNNPYTTIGEVK